MTMAAQTLVDNFQKFTKESLEWCANESEESTAKVSQAIDTLLNDAARVSELSSDSIQAISGLQSKLKVHFDSGSSIDDLVETLSKLANEHDEVKNVIHPIIESLQFQDRLRQNLENIAKMIPAWLEARQTFGVAASQQDLRDVGEKLLKLTTMKEEREQIRSQIEGLSNDEAQDSVMMF